MIVVRMLVVLVVSSLAMLVQAAESGLRQRLEARDGWVAYDVPIVAGAGAPCCFADGRGTGARRPCRLDGRTWSFGNDARDLAPPGALTVYWHVEAGRIDTLRALAVSCPIADDADVRRIDAVDAKDSIALVSERLARGDSSRRDVDGAMAVLAYHADAEALQRLEELSKAGQANAIREKALFWLGQTRGAEGAAIVEQVARNDEDADLREHAVFALSQARVDDAYARVHAIARRDADANVRSKALFWMAQMDAPSARDDIIAALRNDSADEVREQAVFALSQLDGDAADDALIAVVKGDYPRVAKEKALFWLGQSGSRRALDFIDSMLARSPPRA